MHSVGNNDSFLHTKLNKMEKCKQILSLSFDQFSVAWIIFYRISLETDFIVTFVEVNSSEYSSVIILTCLPGRLYRKPWLITGILWNVKWNVAALLRLVQVVGSEDLVTAILDKTVQQVSPWNALVSVLDNQTQG